MQDSLIHAKARDWWKEIAAILLVMNLWLALAVSNTLPLMMYLLGIPAAAVILRAALFARKGSRRVSSWPLLAALLSPIPLLMLQPFFVNLRVASLGPEQLLADARSLVEIREQELQANSGRPGLEFDWNFLSPDDPLVPKSLRSLNPLFLTVEDGEVRLRKVGHAQRDAVVIKTEGQGSSGPVDWSQLWTKSESSDAVERVRRRVIAPRIEWEQRDVRANLHG